MISKKNASGFTLLEFLIVLAILGIIVAVALPGLFWLRTQEKAKEYFGVSNASGLSADEKAMLAPMVENRIVETKMMLDDMITSRNRLLSRKDITPQNADTAINDLRTANILIADLQEKFDNMCVTAKNFKFVSDNFQKCE